MTVHYGPLNVLKTEPSRCLRCAVLLFASCTTIGSYYVYDTPSSLYSQLQDELLFYNNEVSSATFDLYFNLLYSVYSIPNILLPFIGGHLVDTIGMRACIVLFASLVLVGQFITALGCNIHSMATMLLGRLLFGLGGECLVVGQSAFIASWFHGKEVAFALGFILSISRLGSVANDWISPYIATNYGVDAAFWFGTFLCFISALLALLLAHLDRNHRGEIVSTSGGESKQIQSSRGRGALHGSYFETPDVSLHEGPPSSSGQPTGDDDEICEDGLFHLMGFDTMFWLLATICALSYGAIMPFNNIAQVYLLKHYIKIGMPAPEGVDCGFRPLLPEWQDYCDGVDKARERAGSLQSVPFLCAALLAPVIGYIIDKYGHRTMYIILGPALLLLTHIIFLVGETDAILPLLGLGLAYSIIVAVLWPSVPLTVHDNASSHRCGTAFGILTVFQNLSMALIPMVVAALHEVSHDYVLGEYFFILVSIAAVIAAIYLAKEDEAHGAVLRKHVINEHYDIQNDPQSEVYGEHHPFTAAQGKGGGGEGGGAGAPQRYYSSL